MKKELHLIFLRCLGLFFSGSFFSITVKEVKKCLNQAIREARGDKEIIPTFFIKNLKELKK
ncbi:MAG: hypothetical protein EBS06_05400 [Proteobacteria bacterium]|nr:hypothetical protein [Pseudomonadota bacterium]